MKLTHFALVLALGLLGVTGWLAWDSNLEAKGLRNRLDLMQKQNAPQVDEAAIKQKEAEALIAQIGSQKLPPLPPTPAEKVEAPAPVAASPATTAKAPASAAAPRNSLEKLAANGHVGPAAISAQPPMTPQQRVVLGAPSLAKVSEYHQDYGFVIINAGSDKKLEKGMTFALRRANGIIARIEISDVDQSSAIGNIKANSVPPGVTVQVGDDVIQDLPAQS